MGLPQKEAGYSHASERDCLMLSATPQENVCKDGRILKILKLLPDGVPILEFY